MRKGRLFQVICHLLEKGQSTAADMAGEFGVSVRTIYRDVETLNAAGIPVYAETGRHGGICLMKGFVLDRALLSRQEREDILKAVRARENEFAEPGPSTLPKLAALFELPVDDCVEVDLSWEGGSPKAGERFRFLQRAAAQHHCAELTCAVPGGEPVKLSVRPLKLSCRAGDWYLKAYCPERQEYILMLLSRIMKWKPSVETFEPQLCPEDGPAPQLKLTRVVARFPIEAADRVYTVFDSSVITQRKDGSLELRQEMPVDDRLIGRLLSLGPGVRVSSPASLRNELARQAREIYQANK